MRNPSVEKQRPGWNGVVTFGSSYHAALPAQIAELGVVRVFLVGSRSLFSTSPELQSIQELLGDKLIGVKEGVGPQRSVLIDASDFSPLDDLLFIANEVKRLSIDCVVTLGGGSISDACKPVKIATANNAFARENVLHLRAKVNLGTGEIGLPDRPLNSPSLKLICIPTSLSAGEYNPNSGSLDKQTGQKVRLYHPNAAPDVIICDPFITAKTPQWVWLSTGIRSLDHAIETLASLDVKRTAAVQESAERALGLLIPGLLKSKEEDSSEARDMCQRGAWEASQAITHGIALGGSHAIGHLLGSVGGVAHGYTSCVLLPAVMKYNYNVNKGRQMRIMEVLRSQGVLSMLGMTDSPEIQTWDVLSTLLKKLEMPRTLSDVGLTRDKWDRVAVGTLSDFWARTNPIPICTKEQVLEILELAA